MSSPDLGWQGSNQSQPLRLLPATTTSSLLFFLRLVSYGYGNLYVKCLPFLACRNVHISTIYPSHVYRWVHEWVQPEAQDNKSD